MATKTVCDACSTEIKPKRGRVTKWTLVIEEETGPAGNGDGRVENSEELQLELCEQCRITIGTGINVVLAKLRRD